jgi:hypothetical protein
MAAVMARTSAKKVGWLRWHKLSGAMHFVVVGLLLLLASHLKSASVQLYLQNEQVLQLSQAAETLRAADAEDPTLVFYAYHEGNDEYPKNLAFFIKVYMSCLRSRYEALTHLAV